MVFKQKNHCKQSKDQRKINFGRSAGSWELVRFGEEIDVHAIFDHQDSQESIPHGPKIDPKINLEFYIAFYTIFDFIWLLGRRYLGGGPRDT